MRLKEASTQISYDLLLSKRDMFELETGKILCIDINASTVYIRTGE